MDKEENHAAITQGAEDGNGLLEFIKWREGQFSSDKEKLLWWASFLGYLGGICAASIGPEALEAVAAMNHKTTAKVLAEHKH